MGGSWSQERVKRGHGLTYIILTSSGQELWWVGWYYHKHHRKLEMARRREHLVFPSVGNAVEEVPSVLQNKRQDAFRWPQWWAVRGKTAQGTTFQTENWKGVKLCLIFSKMLGLIGLVVLWKATHKVPALRKERSHRCGSHSVLLQSVAWRREGCKEFIQCALWWEDPVQEWVCTTAGGK